jgi:eukaryotic-like serine/threonine-protein kinase
METSAPSHRTYRFGQFEADVQRGRLTSRGVTVRIPEQSFSALALLLERRGDIVTREEFRRQIWPDGTFVEFEGSLNAILKRLRAALDDDADNPRFIETLPRRGYKFIAPVTEISSANGAALLLAPEPSEVGSSNGAHAATEIPHSGRKQIAWRRWLAGSAIAAMSVAIGYFALRGRLKSAGAAPAVQPEAITRPVVQRRSIAVLGFQNATGKADDAWLSTALSEMLSTELAAGDRLRLVSGEDVAHLRVQSPWSQADTLGAESASRIGRSLNSDLLVLGSYTSVGPSESRQIRVDARLQEAKSGEILTEVAVIGGDQNLFELVSRIGGLLRDRLGISPVPAADEPAVLASLPSNMQAARLYSLGLEKLRDFDYKTAKDLFDQAIQADPKFPLAHAMASEADNALGYDDQSKQEAKIGRDLSEKLSPVQKMEIEARYYEAYSDRARAADTYHVLFTLYPDNLDFGLQLASAQSEAFKPDEALETIRQLRQLVGPSSDDPRIDLQEGWLLMGQNGEEADRLYHSAAAKAAAQGKRLILAKAKQRICLQNFHRLADPLECREAYEIFLAAGSRSEAGYSQQCRAEAQRLSGHPQASEAFYEAALREFQQAGTRRRIAITQNNFSLALEDEGKWNEAEVRFLDAKKGFEDTNDKGSLAAVLSNLADIQEMHGNLRQAANLYRQSWELGELTGDKRPEGSRVNYGDMLLIRGEIQAARQEIEPQIAAFRKLADDPWGFGASLTAMGDVDVAAADFEGARKYYQEALDVMEKGNGPTQIQQLSLADLDTEEGHADRAEPVVRKAIADLEQAGSAGDEITAYQSLGRALLAEGKLPDAQNAISHALNMGEARKFPGIYLPLRILHARIIFASATAAPASRAALAEASRELTSAVAEGKSVEMYDYEIEGRLALGELHLKANSAGAQAELKALAAEASEKGYTNVSNKAAALLTSSQQSAKK